ncbi:MAG: GNAT family protein [Candidatus Buchananbacteria bacterium]
MKKEIILKGKLVTLRPLSQKDAGRFCQWLNDSEVLIFLDIYDRSRTTLKMEKEWISKMKREKTRAAFAIDANDGTHIGVVSLRDIEPLHKNAQFGIIIGDKKYWGQGCGTEAGKLIIDYGFRKLKLHRIWLGFYAYNIRAEKSYKKLGFKKEGCLRQQLFRKGHYHDLINMGILRDEWLKRQKPGQFKKR